MMTNATIEILLSAKLSELKRAILWITIKFLKIFPIKDDFGEIRPENVKQFNIIIFIAIFMPLYTPTFFNWLEFRTEPPG